MPTPEDFEPASRTYTSQGLDLHYLDWGNEGAPTLLLVHGSRDHARSWDATARALRDDWHVLAADLRGHGDSAWSPDGAYLLLYHILDLAELLETLGGGPIVLVAHSLGGSVASRFAGIAPERVDRLVLVDGLGPSPDAVDAWAKAGPVGRMRTWIGQRRHAAAAAPPRRFATIEEGAARMRATNPRLSDAQALHLARHGMRAHADGYAWKFDPRAGIFAPEDFAIDGAHFWREVRAPTLICHPTESWNEDPARDGRAAHFADHRIVKFEGAGHWLHHDQFEAFVAALRDFLAARP